LSLRTIILGCFALLLAAAAIFYNVAGGDTAEGGAPCFGLGLVVFVAILIVTFSIKGKSSGTTERPLGPDSKTTPNTLSSKAPNPSPPNPSKT
jgi:hypothetical protein